MNAEELLKRYAAGERDFTSVGAGNVDFSGANLQTVALSDITLIEPIFTGANLSGANLRRATLNYACIDYVDLSNSNLEETELRYSRFHSTILSNANLQGSDLSHAELIDVNLSNANLDFVNLSNTLLHCVELRGTNLKNVQMIGAKLRGSNLLLNTHIKNKYDAELLKKLIDTTYNLHLFYSDGDYNMTAFVWEIPGQDTITVSNIIQWGSYSEKTASKVDDINWFTYPNTSAQAEEYNFLIEIFRNHLKDTKIYWIAEDSDALSGSVDVYVIGKTPSGNFAGIAAPHLAWT